MKIDFSKNTDGLVPVIVQEFNTLKVLMLGYMNQAAYEKTQKENRVTFFSRSKNRLWTKGETSGNYLNVKKIQLDCDNDTLLIQAAPNGPTCHTGATTCFKDETPKGFIYTLQSTIASRIDNNERDSYTNQLYQKGMNKVAQKVGEEAVEVVIEAKDNNDDLFLNESADLLFHYLMLLQAKGYRLNDIVNTLKEREK